MNLQMNEKKTRLHIPICTSFQVDFSRTCSQQTTSLPFFRVPHIQIRDPSTVSAYGRLFRNARFPLQERDAHSRFSRERLVRLHGRRRNDDDPWTWHYGNDNAVSAGWTTWTRIKGGHLIWNRKRGNEWGVRGVGFFIEGVGGRTFDRRQKGD